jgi:hypothetical protein
MEDRMEDCFALVSNSQGVTYSFPLFVLSYPKAEHIHGAAALDVHFDEATLETW